MFQVQNTKSSVNLTSGTASITQHLFRVDLQTFIWRSFMRQNITTPSLKGREWQESEGQIIPVCFEGNQFPPSLSRSKNNTNSKKRNIGNGDSLRKRKNYLLQEIKKMQ